MIEIKDLGFGVIEIFDKDTQYAPAQSIKIGNNIYIREDLINKQIADLEAKLAEKEKQLENAQNLKAIEVADELSLKLSKIHNQDKISFAIAELEKVKEKALHFYVNDTPELTSFYVDVKEIDNQIKRLTNKHEDKGE